MFKQWKCEHDYKQVGEVHSHTYETQDPYETYSHLEKIIIFCPKCRNRKKIKPNKWEVMKNIQNIKNDYKGSE